MHQVLFITVKVSTNYPWLDDKMLQITEAGQREICLSDYPRITVDSYDEIINYKNDAKWLFVQSAGDMILNRDHLSKKIETITEDIGVMGHIIWYCEDETPHLHEQCFIINTDVLKNQFIDFSKKECQGPMFVRGYGDMNCGHAPLSVTLSSEIKHRKLGFGTELMQKALEQNFRVVNFDSDWRHPTDNNDKLISIDDLVEKLKLDPGRFRMASRGYFYPTIGPELLEKALQTLTPLEGLEETQHLIIRIINKMLDYKYFNVWQWDVHKPHIQADTVISPANGLLGEAMALSSNAKKIIFYDINPNNIEFKKELYRSWNGKNYQAFADDFCKGKDLVLEPLISSAKSLALDLDSENQKIFKNWDKIKNLDIEFYNVDLISYGYDFIKKEKNFYIHTSTILGNFILTHLLHSTKEINNFRSFLETHVKETNSYWSESG